jgi:hypothetical protein
MSSSLVVGLFGAALLLGLGTYIRWLGRQPVYHRGKQPAEFSRFIATLQSESPDGAVLVVEHEGTKRFVQFAKYVEEPADRAVTLGFPDAPWSRAFYEPVREQLTAAGFEVSESFGTGTVVPRFLDVAGLEAPERAAEAAVLAFAAMGIGHEATFTLYWPAPAGRKEPVEFKPRAV